MSELGLGAEIKFTPILIGICGGSASGKTTAASYITNFVGEENCLLFSLDNYFFGPNDEERKHIEDYNFDRPEALDLDLAYQHLLELKEGKTIDMPVYSFNVSKRMNYTQKVSPKKVIIFEGIFSFLTGGFADIKEGIVSCKIGVKEIRKLSNNDVFGQIASSTNEKENNEDNKEEKDKNKISDKWKDEDDPETVIENLKDFFTKILNILGRVQ